MNYLVSKNPLNTQWVISVTPPSSAALFGTRIGWLDTKREAVRCARLLAGSAGTVEVIK